MSINNVSVNMGHLPRRIVVGLISNEAFNGSLVHNPFAFKNYDVNNFVLYIDGDQFPNKPLKPNLSEDQFLRSYMTLFEGTGMLM